MWIDARLGLELLGCLRPLGFVKVLKVCTFKSTVTSKAKPHAEELGTAGLTLAKKFSAILPCLLLDEHQLADAI